MPNVIQHSLFTDFDIELFKVGKHYRLYEKMGSHIIELDGKWGTYFAVWAPNAKRVSVIGDFNNWQRGQHALFPRWDKSGIWEGFIPNIGKGKLYKYAIDSAQERQLTKGDPYALFWEIPPNTSSITWESHYDWQDDDWMQKQASKNSNESPFSVYEVHIGSWKKLHGGAVSMSYLELADKLVDYVKKMGFTHVEFLPIMEHPYYPSWGYQTIGYYAPTSRYGKPEEFMALVDAFHRADIGVILDWVPSHFPEDAHGLADFDGTHQYDHADPRLGFHPDWKSCIFNYGRPEVRSFLISNALYWLEKYHIDGIRVDAVASMIYLDYSRDEGQWIPNMYGGNENLEAISFLKELNTAINEEYPAVTTIAEESTAFAGVSHPVKDGGLGFKQKWMMGWMNDTLEYFKKDPFFRKNHHHELTFSLDYAFSENFMLPLSHDEVVHLKGSLMDRMPGNEWQKFAQLRLLYGYMFTHPGTQLLFMGDEFAQTSEWSHGDGLKWELLDYPTHEGVQEWVKDINHYYKNTPALYVKQFVSEGFQWLNHADWQNSVLQYIRQGNIGDKDQIIICNFTPVTRESYRIGIPHDGIYQEKLNSNATKYGGDGVINQGDFTTTEGKQMDWDYYITITLAPFATMIFEKTGEGKRAKKKVKSKKNTIVLEQDLSTQKSLLQSLGKADKATKNDLKKIKGIGPKLEKLLNQLGIYTYQQISKMKLKEYQQVDELLKSFKGRGQRDKWAQQAKKLL